MPKQFKNNLDWQKVTDRHTACKLDDGTYGVWDHEQAKVLDVFRNPFDVSDKRLHNFTTSRHAALEMASYMNSAGYANQMTQQQVRKERQAVGFVAEPVRPPADAPVVNVPNQSDLMPPDQEIPEETEPAVLDASSPLHGDGGANLAEEMDELPPQPDEGGPIETPVPTPKPKGKRVK